MKCEVQNCQRDAVFGDHFCSGCNESMNVCADCYRYEQECEECANPGDEDGPGPTPREEHAEADYDAWRGK